MNLIGILFFFFKQKTAYEVRPRDWSSDVCSSDLLCLGQKLRTLGTLHARPMAAGARANHGSDHSLSRDDPRLPAPADYFGDYFARPQSLSGGRKPRIVA